MQQEAECRSEHGKIQTAQSIRNKRPVRQHGVLASPLMTIEVSNTGRLRSLAEGQAARPSCEATLG